MPQKAGIQNSTKSAHFLKIIFKRVFPSQSLTVMFVGALIWLLTISPILLDNARASQLGERRSVAIDILAPLSAISQATHLSFIVNLFERISGVNKSCNLCGGAVEFREGSKTAEPANVKPTTPTSSNVGASTPSTLPSLDSRPITILDVGDSLGNDLGYGIANALSGNNGVNVVVDGHPATGLSRPDYFNWNLEMSRDLSKYHPQLVIMMLGGNDAQSFYGPNGEVLSFGTPEWRKVYSQRVSSIINQVSAYGAYLAWVGMPPMGQQQFSDDMNLLNSIYQTSVSNYKGAIYISTWKLFSSPNGGYSQFLNINGTPTEVRSSDQIHFTLAGQSLLANYVIMQINQTLKSKF